MKIRVIKGEKIPPEQVGFYNIEYKKNKLYLYPYKNIFILHYKFYIFDYPIASSTSFTNNTRMPAIIIAIPPRIIA
jgi:hypothetical protein